MDQASGDDDVFGGGPSCGRRGVQRLCNSQVREQRRAEETKSDWTRPGRPMGVGKMVALDSPHVGSKVSSTLLALRFFGIAPSNAAGPRLAIGRLARPAATSLPADRCGTGRQALLGCRGSGGTHSMPCVLTSVELHFAAKHIISRVAGLFSRVAKLSPDLAARAVYPAAVLSSPTRRKPTHPTPGTSVPSMPTHPSCRPSVIYTRSKIHLYAFLVAVLPASVQNLPWSVK